MKTLVVVQARLASTRLPRKVLLPLAGKPMLLRQLERISAARSNFDLVVATSTNPEDDALAALAEAEGYDIVRGHPTDLLDRHYWAAVEFGADVVVKIPSDCPLIDPQIIDSVFSAWDESAGALDYLSNLHPATYPDGNDVEMMSFAALETAWREASHPYEREHTTPFLWDQPARFCCGNVTWETGRNASMTHRFTVDYPEDHAFVSAIYDALCTNDQPIFSLGDILGLLEARPDLMAINARYIGVNWYRHHLNQLRTIRSNETRSEDNR